MIGFFDSGFGGLTVLKSVVGLLPDYDYMYIGDNARVPYGCRSQEVVYRYTRQAVNFLFEKGCHLIIIACNTASAKALRRIQREFLPISYPERRVLGVIRPLAEEVLKRGCRGIGILATEGVVASCAYITEIRKLDSSIEIFQQACPLLVPIVEAGEQDWEGTDMIVSKYISNLFSGGKNIDTILLACTHYPVLLENFRRNVPAGVKILEQGPIAAKSLKDYLERHRDLDNKLSKRGSRTFFTTDTSENFDRLARVFYGEAVKSKLLSLKLLR